MVDKGGIVTLRGGSYRSPLIYSTSFDFDEDSDEAENDYVRLIDRTRRFFFYMREGALVTVSYSNSNKK